MKIVINIPEGFYEYVKKYYDKCGLYEKFIANGTPLPNNATNGDIMKTVFPNLHFGRNSLSSEYIVFVNHHPLVSCSKDWWDTPYKIESENNNADSD